MAGVRPWPSRRAVHSDAKVILLDEPPAAMGAKESAIIIDLIQGLRQRGEVSMIIIAHKVEMCDRVNLVQHGRITFAKPTDETSVRELTDLVSAECRSREI